MQRQQQTRRSSVSGGVMRYVLCPKCGDPVAGRLTAELTCVHCKEQFAFDQSEARTGILLYDENNNRWRVG